MEKDTTPVWASQDDPQEGLRKATPAGPDGRKPVPNEYGPDPFEVFRPDIPSPARMYDYYLGGKDHYPSDREAAQRIIDLMPPGVVRAACWQNRRFMWRAVRYLTAEAGIRQFIDIGAGLPTMGPVHEVAQDILPESHVVYVDNDLVVVAHCWEMLSGVSHAAIIRHDLRAPEDILADPELRRLIDLEQPVAVLLVAIMHFIGDDEDPAGIIRRLMEPLPSGSHLVLSHWTGDRSPAESRVGAAVYRQATSTVHGRTKSEVLGLLGDLERVEPGLVWVPEWRPDLGTDSGDINKSAFYGTVARKL